MELHRKTGKLPARADHRVAFLDTMAGRLLPPPDDINWYAAVGEWDMYGNDKYGCCVEAGTMHAIKQFAAYAENPLVNPTTADTLQFYTEATGFNPADPNTDQGSYVMGKGGTMELWHTNGVQVGTSRNKVEAYVQIGDRNLTLIRQAIWTFGGVLLGFNCPEYLVASPDVPYVWRDTKNVATAGGHEVWLNGCIRDGDEYLFDTISWGGRYRMTGEFIQAFSDEIVVAYDSISLNRQGLDGRGLPEAALLETMRDLRAAA